jgi:hypothetical protein
MFPVRESGNCALSHVVELLDVRLTERPHPRRRGHPINHHVSGAQQAPRAKVRLVAPGLAPRPSRLDVTRTERPPPRTAEPYPAPPGLPAPAAARHDSAPAVASRAPTAPLRTRPARRMLAEPGSYQGARTRFSHPRSGHPPTRATLTDRHRHRADRPPRNLTREPSRGP